MSLHTSPIVAHHHVTVSHSPTPSSSPPSLSLDDVGPVHLVEPIPSLYLGVHENDSVSIRTRTPTSSLRRSVSSYSVDDANYHPHVGSTTSISTIATTAVLAAHHPHHYYHRHASPLPTGADEQLKTRTTTVPMAYPLVYGLRSQVDKTPKAPEVSKVTTAHHLHSTSSSSSSSPRGRFRKFAVKVVKWIRQSVVEARAKSEVRVKCLYSCM